VNDYAKESKLPKGAKWNKSPDENYFYEDWVGRKRFVMRRYHAAFMPNREPALDPATGKQLKKFAEEWFEVPGRLRPAGYPKLLYRLPELLAARAAGVEEVQIYEGERKAELARKWGYCATCCPGGAGKWLPDHAELLRSFKRAVVVPDNDEPGRQHADVVGRSLINVVPNIRLLELPNLPPKGDIVLLSHISLTNCY
jgi:hypothetical protein